eukprot:309850-Amphidinium_carterae.1
MVNPNPRAPRCTGSESSSYEETEGVKHISEQEIILQHMRETALKGNRVVEELRKWTARSALQLGE